MQCYLDFQIGNEMYTEKISIEIDPETLEYKVDVTFTVSPDNEVSTEYSLRDNVVKCQLAALALGDLEINDFAEAKSIYDKMHTVFECEEYVLTEEVLDALEAFFDDCGYTKIRCGCGC